MELYMVDRKESCPRMATGDKIIEERRVSLTSINYYFSFMSSIKKHTKQDALFSIYFVGRLVRSLRANVILLRSIWFGVNEAFSTLFFSLVWELSKKIAKKERDSQIENTHKHDKMLAQKITHEIHLARFNE